MRSPSVSFDETTSRPIRVAGGELRLKSRALKLSLGSNGGLVWNFPVRVIYAPDGAAQQSLPVIDQTRLVQIGFYALALLFAAVLATRFIPRAK